MSEQVVTPLDAICAAVRAASSMRSSDSSSVYAYPVASPRSTRTPRPSVTPRPTDRTRPSSKA